LPGLNRFPMVKIHSIGSYIIKATYHPGHIWYL